jgi:anthranilate phosphoribosyltransferase
MLDSAIQKLIRRCDLTEQEAMGAGCELFDSNDPYRSSAFLVLLKAKGETADELIGLIRAVRKKSLSLCLDRPILDIVGTGGDGAGTINISTGSALLAAACGIPVVKHGNRAVSSKCGSADVLEALGYPFLTRLDDLQKSLAATNFAFCFAPDFYPALQSLRAVRKGLNMPTVFHLMGPLLNPAGTDHLMIGVYDASLVELVAEILFRLGTDRSLVFHGCGIDELSCIGTTSAIFVTRHKKERIEIDPGKMGLRRCTIDDLRGQDAETNARILREALSGKNSPIADTLILNAGVALFLYGASPTILAGIERASERLAQGSIVKKNYLQEIIQKRTKRPLRKSLRAAIRSRFGAVVAEIKRASPSAGSIAAIPRIADKVQAYEQAGAAAISILTNNAFGGSMQDLQEASRISNVPLLCKDFILDAEQIVDAARAGADAVLLIVAALKERTAQFVQMAHLLGLETIVEIHKEEELSIALDAKADIIGVNQRDLSDFSMHPEIFERLIHKIEPSIFKIAESGIQSMEEANRLFAMGFDGVLVGEALSRETFILGGQNVH